MEESEGSGFEEFFVEMEESEYVKVRKFDRMLNFGEGGSIMQEPLLHEGVLYAAAMDRNVYCLDGRTGRLIWNFVAEGGFAGSSPVIAGGMLYIGSYDQNMYCLDAGTGKLIWKFHTMGKIVASATVHEGRVYFGSSDYNCYCLDAGTGKLIWKFRTYGEVMFRPTVHEGSVFFGSNDQFLYRLDAGSGNVMWKHETQGEIFCQNALLIRDGIVYFPSFDNILRAADLNTGRLVWKFRTGTHGGMASSPFLYKGVLYQPNREGVLWALTPAGKELWNFRINNTMSHPLVHGDRIYIGTERLLYCLGLDGKKLWTFETQGETWWRPAAWDGKVYFTSCDCNIYCVDTATRQLVWKFRAQGEPSYMPLPFGSFELSVKKSVDDSDFTEGAGSRKYSAAFGEEEGGTFYKSKVTYRMSSQYAAKGKYQKDSDEEAL